MAAEEQIPGDVISMGGSDSEEETSHVEKRSLADVDGSDVEDDQSSHASKRRRLSRLSLSSNASKGSEEGEIEDSISKSVSSQSGQSDSQLKDSAKSFVPSDPPLFTTDAVSLKLPALSRKKEGSWVDRVSNWSTVLCTTNFDSLAEIKPATVVSAFGHYIDVHSGLKPPKKRTAKQTIRAMEESGKISMLLANAKPPSSEPGNQVDDVEDGEVADSPEYEPTESALLETGQPANGHTNDAAIKESGEAAPARQPTAEQRRYFPSAEDAAEMCVLCGRKGHVADACSHSKYANCGNESIEEAASLHLRAKPNTGRQQAKMARGPSARALNVHYSESDDSDTDLLSQRAAPRQRRPPLGRMQMSTNIQMPTAGGHAVQPPLPPGPPPPLPPPTGTATVTTPKAASFTE
ncbi:hypothetical protein V2A60_003878 [Cordyceps javanica]